ncbi:MAG: hypothetical protein ACJ71X_06940 [Nitrososphaeraceae archaeon]
MAIKRRFGEKKGTAKHKGAKGQSYKRKNKNEIKTKSKAANRNLDKRPQPQSPKQLRCIFRLIEVETWMKQLLLLQRIQKMYPSHKRYSIRFEGEKTR